VYDLVGNLLPSGIVGWMMGMTRVAREGKKKNLASDNHSGHYGKVERDL